MSLIDFARVAGAVAHRLFGKPSWSTKNELRYRPKGSLAIDIQKGTWFDFETNEKGGVLDLIRRETGLAGKEAVAWIEREVGIECAAFETATVKQATSRIGKADYSHYALRIWNDARPAADTALETYLRSRLITHSPPDALRFAPRLWHKASRAFWPAMVAVVTRGADDKPIAIHRTFLKADGSGKAPVEPQKMMLGPCRSGAVRLAVADDFVMVGEGIETCLAVMQATGLPAWAALSTSGLLSLDLPEHIRRVTLLADGDEPGEQAAMRTGARWKSEGREVRIARPPRGKDFADLLMEEDAS